MAFYISPGVYTTECDIHYSFPDDMPYGATKLHTVISRLEWEIKHIRDNSHIYLNSSDSCDRLDTLCVNLMHYKQELLFKYPKWAENIG